MTEVQMTAHLPPPHTQKKCQPSSSSCTPHPAVARAPPCCGRAPTISATPDRCSPVTAPRAPPPLGAVMRAAAMVVQAHRPPARHDCEPRTLASHRALPRASVHRSGGCQPTPPRCYVFSKKFQYFQKC
jgi:hypothetical protein